MAARNTEVDLSIGQKFTKFLDFEIYFAKFEAYTLNLPKMTVEPSQLVINVLGTGQTPFRENLK